MYFIIYPFINYSLLTEKLFYKTDQSQPVVELKEEERYTSIVAENSAIGTVAQIIFIALPFVNAML